MRVSREQAAENREKILSTATRLFREKGFDGIGIADLMKNAGLTHGGFYGHFSSKEDLMAQACDRAVDELLARNQARLSGDEAQLEGSRYQRFIAHYLSSEHRDDPGSGCLMAALGADAARQSPMVKHAFTQSCLRLFKSLMSILPAKGEAAKREQALATLASLVGAQVIARALDDPELSQEVLQAVFKKLH
jgi:TetR/AcrR family transcriptional regulator, transcriptional repressor for nem operon